MEREFSSYSPDGLLALAECCRYWRQARKPFWSPVVTASMTGADIEAEKSDWTQRQMAAIIKRELGIPDSIEALKSAIQRLERPTVGQSEPQSLQLIEYIASLEICRPLVGDAPKPYRGNDLLDIAKNRLDWKTGNRLYTAHCCHG